MQNQEKYDRVETVTRIEEGFNESYYTFSYYVNARIVIVCDGYISAMSKL